MDKTNIFGSNLCQAKNDYTTYGINFSLFSAPKIKYCLTIDKNVNNQQHMTFKGFNDSKRLLDRSQYFKMLDGKKISVLLPRSWKNSFKNGFFISIKRKRCKECKGEILCIKCNNQVNEIKKFETNINLSKKQAPNRFGHMLPFCKLSICCQLLVIVYLLYTLFKFFN